MDAEDSVQETYQSETPAEPEASVEQSESLSIAFLRLLEYLSPLERAVFLLRQVFDFEYDEIAKIVQKDQLIQFACKDTGDEHRIRMHDSDLMHLNPRFPRAC